MCIRDRCSEDVCHPLGLAMIDIDCFKEYNDYYGHIEGDKILYEVGDSLNKYKMDTFHICRYGGDEFACIFEYCLSLIHIFFICIIFISFIIHLFAFYL